MVIRNLLNKKIDISSQEIHPDPENSGEETLHMAIVLGPLKEVTIDDRYRRLKNIDEAIKNSWIEVVSYDDSATSTVVHPETSGSGLESSTLSLDNGETDTLDSVDASNVNTAKWLVSVVDGTNNTVMSTEIYAQHDGVDSKHNCYAKLGSSSVSFDVVLDSGELKLVASATANSQTITAKRISVES